MKADRRYQFACSEVDVAKNVIFDTAQIYHIMVKILTVPHTCSRSVTPLVLYLPVSVIYLLITHCYLNVNIGCRKTTPCCNMYCLLIHI